MVEIRVGNKMVSGERFRQTRGGTPCEATALVKRGLEGQIFSTGKGNFAMMSPDAAGMKEDGRSKLISMRQPLVLEINEISVDSVEKIVSINPVEVSNPNEEVVSVLGMQFNMVPFSGKGNVTKERVAVELVEKVTGEKRKANSSRGITPVFVLEKKEEAEFVELLNKLTGRKFRIPTESDNRIIWGVYDNFRREAEISYDSSRRELNIRKNDNDVYIWRSRSYGWDEATVKEAKENEWCIIGGLNPFALRLIEDRQ